MKSIEEMEQIITQLRERNEELKKENEELRGENEVLRKGLREAAANLKGLWEENEVLRRELKELRRENDALKEKLKEAKANLKEVKEKTKSLEKAFEKLRKELRKYNNENTPSGSLSPYLKPTIEIRKEIIEDEKKKTKDNPRNSRPGKVDRVEVLSLSECSHCGGRVVIKKTKPAERIIFILHLPEAEAVKQIKPIYRCLDCGREVVPKTENEIPKTKFDLTTFVFISVLSVGLNLSLGKIAELLSFFGLKISRATLSNYLKKFKDYLGEDYEELKTRILAAKAKSEDDTGWRTNGKLNWVLVAATVREICYWIVEKRNYKTIKRVFKGDRGIATVDGYRGYDQLERPVQRDWAHLFRIAKNPEYWFTSKEEVKEYKKLVRNLQELYHRAKEEKEKLRASRKLREKYEEKLLKILSSVKCLGKNANKLINYIMHYNTDWFVFLEHKKVEPTSNRAERALRHIVLKRKISQQSRSNESKQSYAMQVSLYMTSKINGQNYMNNLRHIVERKLNVTE